MVNFNQNFETINHKVLLPIFSEKKIELWIKREDTIDELVSGNKFRKLKYNILEAKKSGYKTIITFGGAYSNHIAATAMAGKIVNLKTVGIIRGNEFENNLNEVLKQNNTLYTAKKNGMEFKFISREEYRTKESASFLERLRQTYKNFYLIPEGGTNRLAIKGCEEIITKKDKKFDYICCPIGTGGTIAGIVNSSDENQSIIGFPALKGEFLQKQIRKLTKKSNWFIESNYHFGGYGKFNTELINFINKFTEINKIQLDPIYTGKMMYGINDLIKKNKFPKGSKIIAIHTGGLQGIDGINTILERKKLTKIVKL